MRGNVWAVIRREYLQRVRSRWFIFATLAVPLLMLASILVPGYFASKEAATNRKIVLVDRTGALYDRLSSRLAEGGYAVERAEWDDSAEVTLTRRVEDKQIAGFLVLDEETLRQGTATFYSGERPSPLRSLALRQATVGTALEVHLEQQGVEAGPLLGGGDLRVETLGTDSGDLSDGTMMVGFVGSFILYMVILLYAVAVMRATLEEKTSRIVEVVISAMDPWYLMLGKILGVGAVGLTQLAVWGVSGALMMSMGLPALAAARPELVSLTSLGDFLPGAGMLLLFVVLFVFGYFIFSALYAAVGSMCNTDEEAQQAQLPVMLLVIIPIMFLSPVLSSPASPMARALSLFPFFTPILMWPRLTTGVVPAWELGLSLVLMGLTVVGVAWVAGRIYKVGILMTGKRPTLPELWRWVRQG
ncbi:MAG: ABC transporter permease [Gemmatimonadota bacterium]